MLYWTDWGSEGSAIYRSSVVNPDRETLVSGLHWPCALTADFAGTLLANTGTRTIQYSLIGSHLAVFPWDSVCFPCMG